jgi:2-polyprenyl-6-hydroxyphenyl methylase/3-demethylubiquinone-9 3-methyltransferase
MNGSPEPVRPASHFDFGRNWAEYAETIDEAAVERAKAGLDRLRLSDLHGKTFLDIGCGSGIHALAAARQGATVTALDVDRDSVDTTNRLFAAHGRTAVAIQRSIFDACPADLGTFDIELMGWMPPSSGVV